MPNNTPPVNTKAIEIEMRRIEIRATLMLRIAEQTLSVTGPATVDLCWALTTNHDNILERSARAADAIIEEATR